MTSALRRTTTGGSPRALPDPPGDSAARCPADRWIEWSLMEQWIGLAAGALTTAAFVPQVVRTWRTGSTRDLSLGMLLLFFAGLALWLVYGVLTSQLPVILANVVTLVLTGVLIGLKLHTP